MAIDFAHPTISDLYSSGTGTDWPGYLQDNIAAVASWLDGVDPPGKRVGFKRINAGVLQQWNGSAWVALPLSLSLGSPLVITASTVTVPNTITWQSTSGQLISQWRSTTSGPNDVAELRVISNDVQGLFSAYNSLYTALPRANQVWLQALTPTSVLVFGQNNVERMRIDTAGSVAVTGGFSVSGNTTINGVLGVGGGAFPNARIQSYGMVHSYSDGVNPNFRLVNPANDGGGSLMAPNGNSGGVQLSGDGGPIIFLAGGAERVRIDGAGNVGIGAPSPAGSIALYVRRSGAQTTAYLSTDANHDAYVRTDTSLGSFGFGTSVGGAANCWNVFDLAAGAERMRIDAAGNVGIGTPAPAFAGVDRTLALNGTSQSLIHLLVDNVSKLHVFANAAQISIGAQGAGTFLGFATNGAERMRITAAGVIQDGAGQELGYRHLNRNVYNAGASVLSAADNGKCHYKQDASNVTVPSGLPDGALITIYNGSGSARTIAQGGGVTMYFAGTSLTGDRTLAANGLATVWIVSTSAVISGTGLS
jgi:hypothetical protein